jgi:AGZA family xanthine/uracil permease-like MFS transporter
MAGVRLPGNLPGGLLAVIIGTAVGWITSALGWSGVMEPTTVGRGHRQTGLRLPIPSRDVFAGLRDIGPLLVTAIPLSASTTSPRG